MTNHDSTPAAAILTLHCDRCAAQGAPGEDPFARFPALTFTPVPRKKERVDGWNADRQRAFIAALAATGSPRRAAAAVGSAPFGAEQLRKAPGGESFAAAWDAAMAIAKESGTRRVAHGIVEAQRHAAWAPPQPWSRAASRASAHAAPPEPEACSDEAKTAFVAATLHKYVLKLHAERKARLSGDIAAADLYVRQLTFVEVMLDLMGKDGFAVVNQFREENGHDIRSIAETPFSRLLDEVRRDMWERNGEPPRPKPTPADRLTDCGRYSLGPCDSFTGGTGITSKEHQAMLARQRAEAAKAQVLWEAEARADWERRQSTESKATDA
ncbi:hypothetical protein [Allosphingosinicella vermicomposti]|uniref:hypothetical protein n=1 Tax=Allosphingosinicella vermicomposti TaxID=614671 RepID=UPI00131A516B|nr:hypothetical protein [Allosphingosinicella vermicomposti]